MKRMGIAIVLLSILLSGCARRPNSDFESVENRINSLIRKQIEWRNSNFAAAKKEDTAGRELSVDEAVQIALFNNPSLQATFEELGIADADLMESGLLKNPVFDAAIRFPDKGPASAKQEFSLVFNFIDLIMIPVRKKVEGMRFEATKTRVTLAVLNLASETRKAYFELQGEQSKLTSRKTMLDAAQAASEFAQKLMKAGNITELAALPKVTAFHQANLEVMRAELEVAGIREKLNRAMGLSGTEITWRIPGQLPALPAQDAGDVPALESQAVAQRLDLDAQRQEVAIVDKARALRHWGVFTAVQVGPSTERDPDGVRVTGPAVQMEMPIFNQGKADRARLASQLRQSRARLEALEVSARSEIREELAHMKSARATVEYYRDHLNPLRARALELTQERYNNMTLSGLDLLSAKQDQLLSEIEQTQALRDYWIHRTELEHALGGALPSAPVAATLTGVISSETAPAEKPAEPMHERQQ